MYVQFKQQAADVLVQAAKEAGYDVAASDIPFEFSEHADMATRLAFVLASKMKENPAAIASKIISKISLPAEGAGYVGKITAAGPYINITASEKYLTETVMQAVSQKENYGRGTHTGKILLEHTSANPNGPLHVGHIRNSVIGDTLSRILKKAGYEVEVQYYVNDIGRQIAVVSWACSRYELDLTKKSDSAIADVYIKANVDINNDESINNYIEDLMKKVENGDSETIESFTHAVDLAIAGIKETLLLMNIKHDRFIRESRFIENGDVWNVIKRLEESGRTKTEEGGALAVDLKDHGFEKTLIIKRSNGTSLYTTRDLAYHEWKGAQCDRMIDILGADHKLISGQLKATLDVLGSKQPEVVIFEFVSLPEGSMSTRRGKFISADDLVNEVISKAYEEVSARRPDATEEFRQKTARAVGVGAVRYDVVKVSPEKSTIFDWKKALDFEKQGAPYIQYAHARAANILAKAEEEGIFNEGDDAAVRETAASKACLLTESYETDLIRKIAEFDQIIETCAKDLKPHSFAIYARELADSFNQFYRFVSVLNADDEDIRKARLTLVCAAKVAIADALDVLGIEAPDAM
ncbi:arginine--tRNA ligase [Methanosarcinaceae archaeon]|nr:arginine--tRNA ligase [Methanosarcinaceae archaeon]